MQIGKWDSADFLTYHMDPYLKNDIFKDPIGLGAGLKKISDESMIASRNEEIKTTIGENLSKKYLSKNLNANDETFIMSYNIV